MQKLIVLALLLICIQAIKLNDEEVDTYIKCQKENCADKYQACQKDSRCTDRVHHCSTPDLSIDAYKAMALCVKRGLFLANELGSCWVKNCS